MLSILSSLTLLTRVDVTASAWVLASGVTGTWVKLNGDSGATKPTQGDYAMPIFSESKRDGTAGFSPDIHANGYVTVLFGKLRAVTDQYDTGGGAISAGTALTVDATGKLRATTLGGTEAVVAFCTKAAHSFTYIDQTKTVIEFVTV